MNREVRQAKQAQRDAEAKAESARSQFQTQLQANEEMKQ